MDDRDLGGYHYTAVPTFGWRTYGCLFLLGAVVVYWLGSYAWEWLT